MVTQNSFLLGEEALKSGKRSLRSLSSHSRSSKGEKAEAVYVVINSKIKFTKSKEYVPRIIPLTKKLDSLENKSVLLVTKDPSIPYREKLTEKGSPTEDVFSDIFSFKRLKSQAKDGRKLIKIFKEYDIVVADNRIHKFLPDVLGFQFFYKNKKIPYMVQMALPEQDAMLTRGKKSTKLKDDRCDPKYVKSQMKAIARNAAFVAPHNGTCVVLKVGYTDWSTSDLLTNINDIVTYLTNQKYLPVGGMLRSVKNIESVHLKTSDSISLPLYKAEKPPSDAASDLDSD